VYAIIYSRRMAVREDGSDMRVISPIPVCPSDEEKQAA